jgi:hypothetical protein
MAHQLQAITKFVHTIPGDQKDMSSSSSALYFLDPVDAYRSLLTMSPHMFLSSTHQHFSIPPPRQQPVQTPPAVPSAATILEHYHVLRQLRQHEQQLLCQQQSQPDRVGSALYKLYPQQRQRHFGQSSLSRRNAVSTPAAGYADDDVAVVSPQNWNSGSRGLRHLPPDVLLPPLLDVSDDMMVMPPPQPRRRVSCGAGASSAQPPPRPKSVRFSLQQQVFTVPNDDVEPRQWLQPEDLDRQRLADKRIGAVVARDEAYKSAILFLMQSFKAEHYVGRQQLLDQVRVLLEQPEARGLEHRIASVLKSKRIKAVQQFLRQQRTIRRQARTQQRAGKHHDRHHHKRSSSLSSSSGDLMVSLQLRQVSLKLSRGARQLAFRLAQSDRLAAKAIHEEEDC